MSWTLQVDDYLSIFPSIHLSIYPSIHLSIYPSIHLSIYPIYLSISILFNMVNNSYGLIFKSQIIQNFFSPLLRSFKPLSKQQLKTGQQQACNLNDPLAPGCYAPSRYFHGSRCCTFETAGRVDECVIDRVKAHWFVCTLLGISHCITQFENDLLPQRPVWTDVFIPDETLMNQLVYLSRAEIFVEEVRDHHFHFHPSSSLRLHLVYLSLEMGIFQFTYKFNGLFQYSYSVFICIVK